MSEALTVYRRSELEAAECLYRYQQIWMNGIDDTSDYALRGIAFHAIKHRYVMRLVAKGLTQDFEESVLAFPEGIAHAQTPQRLIPEVRDLWDNHARHFALDLDRFVTAEEKQLGGGFQFTPDLVNAYPERNELEIVDDKTYFVALTETQARAEFQSRFYIRHAMDRWPNFSSYRFTYVFVRLGTSVSITFTRDDIDILDREVEALIASIEEAKRTNSWPATAGPACRYCELKCPIVDQMATMPKRLVTYEQAEQLGAWVLAAEQMLKAGKKALKQYCVANGTVDIRGIEWANRPVLERRYPIQEVLRVLQMANLGGSLDAVEVGKDLTVSHSELAKVFRQVPAAEEELAKVAMVKTSYRFSAKKPGGDEGDDE